MTLPGPAGLTRFCVKKETTMNIVRKLLLLLVTLVVGVAALAGCRTAEGFGEDVESVGDSISDTAKDVAD